MGKLVELTATSQYQGCFLWRYHDQSVYTWGKNLVCLSPDLIHLIVERGFDSRKTHGRLVASRELRDRIRTRSRPSACMLWKVPLILCIVYSR